MTEFGLDSISNDFIKVNISNSGSDTIAFEIKFSRNITVAELKRKLEIIVGGSAGTMLIELYESDKLIAILDDATKLLCNTPIKTGMRLHVKDNFNWALAQEVQKFELSQDQYERKNDTVRNFLKSNGLGKYNDAIVQKNEFKRQQKLELNKERANLCVVGSRCQVKVPGNPIRRGTIMYNGSINSKLGTFIGVKYDEPLGKNNGSIDGKVYFVCPPNYGGFVSPISVEVGDFPPEDFDRCDEI